MIFFLSSSCRFVEVWRRERDDQISKLSLPFSSSTSSARASEPLEIKCLCIHYSLVSVRIWWWYWWWWKWSEWIDRSREGQKGQPAKEEKETSFFFPSFFIFFGNDVSFDQSIKIINRHRVQRKRGGVFLSQSFSLFLFLFFSLVALVNHNTHSPH